jgi:ribokinase
MIVTFGSINVDLIVPVPYLPQPGETVLGGDYLLLPGGKGANQALAARRAGSQVVLAGAVGNDSFAAVALDLLCREGVDTRLVRRVEQPTGCAAIMVSHEAENAIAVAPGANAAVRSDQVPDDQLGADTILIAQMEVPVGETGILIRRVRARGGRVLLNLAPALPIDLELLSDVDLLVANEGEIALAGSDPIALARRLRQGLVVTRGAAGAIGFLAEGRNLAVPALPVDPIDTTGAGDTFVGALAAGLDADLTLESALRRASAAAGLACLARGAQTAMPDRAAIDAAMARLPPASPLPSPPANQGRD